MKWILQLKSWQLFLITFLPAVWVSPSPLKECINTIAVFFLALWVYAIASHGFELIPDALKAKMNIKRFKVNYYLFSFCYIALLIIMSFESGGQTLQIISGLIGMLLFYSIIYCIYFASKILAIIKYNSDVAAFDYILYMLAFVFFIFGIWFIQPKANAMAKN